MVWSTIVLFVACHRGRDFLDLTPEGSSFHVALPDAGYPYGVYGTSAGQVVVRIIDR
jgi:hypothetical protein